MPPRARSANRDVAPGFGGDLLAYLGESEPTHDPRAVYHCDGLIVRGEPMLVLGEPKMGKTLFVEDLAICLAAGAPEFCGRAIYGRARVLLMPREDSAEETRRRIWQLTRARGIAHRDLVGWLEVDGSTPLYFDQPATVSRLRTALDRFDAVFIDSLSTIHGSPDENSNGAMKPTVDVWRDLSLGPAKTIAVVHHLRKPGEPGATTRGRKLGRSRGASIIGATARHAVVLEDGNRPGQVRLTIEGNHAHLPDPFLVERIIGDDGAGSWVRHEAVDGPALPPSAHAMDARLAGALDAAGAPLSRTALVAAVGGNKGDVLAAIRDAVKRGAVVAVEPGPRDDARSQLVLLPERARELGYGAPPSDAAPGTPWRHP